MNNSSLRKWLSFNKYIYPKGTKNYTHLLLSGGILIIPEEKMDDFYNIYTTDVENNKKNYVAECRTKVFRFLIDIDLYEDKKVPFSKIKEYVNVINDVIKDFYSLCELSNYKRRVIICTTQPCEKEHNGTTFIKTGVHLVWPRIYVTTETALILRRAIIQKLEEQFRPRHPDNEWTDVIDLTVYTSNGLRMIGSSKCYPCKYCKGKVGDLNCEKCFGVGKIDEGRIYMPKDVIKGNGKSIKQKYTNDFKKILLETSLRTSYDKEPYRIKIPTWYKNTKEESHKRPSGKINHENFSNDSNKELKVREFIGKDSITFKKISTFIKKNFPLHVKKGMTLIDMYKGKNCYIIRTDSKFCMNLDGEHNSNTIYFYVDKYYVYQKCFCRCEKNIGRKFGYCKDYRSKGIELPSTIRSVLYPSNYQDDIGFPREVISSRVERLEKILKQLDDDISNKDEYERKFHLKS